MQNVAMKNWNELADLPIEGLSNYMSDIAQLPGIDCGGVALIFQG